MIKRLTHSNVFEPHHHRFGRTLILGDGPIGLLTTALLRSAVSSRSNRDAAEDITLVGGKPNRLELARQFGADTVINYHDLPTSDLARSILNATACLPGRRESDADQRTGSRKPVAGSRGRGPSRAIPVPSSQVPIPGSRFPVPGSRFHVIIEASGSPAAIDACLDLAAPGGRIMVIGDYADATAGFPWNRLLHKELELIGSNASANAWDEAVALACAGAVPLGKLITHRLPADRFAEGVELMRVRKPDVIKVVLQWT
jgi:threonine dehydrogenase-like Zn-dependent dehydrogenase